jgi:hypothetical protein
VKLLPRTDTTFLSGVVEVKKWWIYDESLLLSKITGKK